MDGWPVLDQQAMHQLSIDAPTLPAHPWNPVPNRDDFDAEALGLEWTQLTVPVAGVLTLQERPGFLRLYGQAGYDASGSAFVGGRQKDLTFTATACLEFAPNGDQEEAGICAFQTTAYRYDLGVTLRAGQRVIRLRKNGRRHAPGVRTDPSPCGRSGTAH